MRDLIIPIVAIIIVVALCSALSVAAGEQASCTTKKLDNSSLIVCTYKDKVLFNGEVKDEEN